MNRVVLVLMVFLPLALAAQDRNSSTIVNQTGVGNSMQADASSISDPVSPTGPETRTDFGTGPETNAPQQPGAQPSQSTKTISEPQPSIPGSMVGYVDSAIVGSQVRIRFDDAFHDSAPDRAEFFYPQCACALPGTAPGPDFPGASTNVNFQQVYLQAEYAPVRRFSIFTEVPFRWIEPQPPLSNFIPNTFDPTNQTPSTQAKGGISDVRAGIKLAVAVSSSHSLTIQLKAYFPSGNGFLGLGTDHYSFEPSLLYYQRLSQRWAVESQIGDSHPIGGSKGVLMGNAVGPTTLTNFAGDVFFYGVGPSYRLIDGEHFKLAPVIELYGWHVLNGLQTLSPLPAADCGAMPGAEGCSYEAGGTNIVNIKAGVRTSFGGRNSVYVGFGQAITHAVWYEHIIRLEYRYAF